jgi:exodeoxyribonuclease VII large subunit
MMHSTICLWATLNVVGVQCDRQVCMFEPVSTTASRIWAVGALCRAVGDALDARFNPVSVSGEISGFTKAASGHCYFTLKDETGQMRCAMFRRAASILSFMPRDGERVEVRGRLGVYEPRGELQLVVESLSKAGRGTLFEQFLLLKAKLEAQGLFDSARKRHIAAMPRAIGVVTSLGAAALHDVVTALQRRVPHIPVVIAPASVQGAGAATELVQALEFLYRLANGDAGTPAIDTILVVRGGGSMDDLWAFNDEQLAYAIGRSPVPVISGVGHETDFTIADFVADLRAPTPTAAAELAASPTQLWLDYLDQAQGRLEDAVARHVDRQSQRLDVAAARVGRPSAVAYKRRLELASLGQTLGHAVRVAHRGHQAQFTQRSQALPRAMASALQSARRRLSDMELRLAPLNPAHVLNRGFAWITDEHGMPITRVSQAIAGHKVTATLVDGAVDMTVQG